MRLLILILVIILIGILIYWISTSRRSYVEQSKGSATYKITIENLTRGQPFSPPVFLTHDPNVVLFREGQLASQGINDISRDGNERTIVKAFSGQPGVTDVVDVQKEIFGQLKTGQPSTVTLTIRGNPGDVLSGAMMISCSNDGFVGLDSAKLPDNIGDNIVYMLQGYDSGRELNTEKSEDIPDPCSMAGLVPIRGKPNGNRDTEVDRIPPRAIQVHSGILGVGDLSPYYHGWTGPMATVTVTRES